MDYSRRDIDRLTSATESNLTHWSKIGLLRADVRETGGRGHHRRFSFRALVEAEIATHLNSRGMPVASIQALIEIFRFVASRGARKGTTAGFKRWQASATKDPTFPALLDLWQTFVTPATRSRIGFTGLMVNTTGWVFAVDEVDQPWPSERTAGPVTIVVNVGHIVEEMEKRTGDLWISTSDKPQGYEARPQA